MSSSNMYDESWESEEVSGGGNSRRGRGRDVHSGQTLRQGVVPGKVKSQAQKESLGVSVGGSSSSSVRPTTHPVRSEQGVGSEDAGSGSVGFGSRRTGSSHIANRFGALDLGESSEEEEEEDGESGSDSDDSDDSADSGDEQEENPVKSGVLDAKALLYQWIQENWDIRVLRQYLAAKLAGGTQRIPMPKDRRKVAAQLVETSLREFKDLLVSESIVEESIVGHVVTFWSNPGAEEGCVEANGSKYEEFKEQVVAHLGFSISF